MYAQFPPLVPASAEIRPGRWPVSAHQAMSGGKSIIRHGSAEIDRRLPLSFVGLTEEQFLWIRNHYRGLRSEFDWFDFSTTTLAASETPAGYAWRWAGPPRVVDRHDDFFDVDCEFKSVVRRSAGFSAAAWVSPRSVLTRGGWSGIDPVFDVGASFITTATTLQRGEWSVVTPIYSLLLNGQGADGSTSITNQSSSGLSVTNYNVQFSSAQSKFGGGSMLFNRSNAYLEMPGGSLLSFPGDYQVEIWFYETARTDNETVLEIGSVPGTIGNIMIRPGKDIYAGTTQIASISLSLNAWHYVKVWRLNGVVSAAVDGSVVGTPFSSTSTHGAASGDLAMIGNSVHAPGPSNPWRLFSGYVGPVRITKNYADSSIAPPSDVFPVP